MTRAALHRFNIGLAIGGLIVAAQILAGGPLPW